MPLPRRAGSLLALWCVATFAAAQGVPYCNVTGIDVKRLSNGVQVTIQADGLMQFSYNYADYLNLEAIQLGNWNQVTKPVTVLPFRIVNARSKVGSVADIGVYPASHVEISIPPEAQDGIGLDFKVVLLAEAIPQTVAFSGQSFTLGTADLTRPIVRITASQDKRSLIILIESDRQVETPVKLRVPAENARRELSVEKSGDRLSIHALNADLRDVVREISNQSGRSILATDDLLHYVTLNLPGVTVAEALDALAIGYGLSVQASGATTLVSEGKIGSLSSFGGSVTESLHLQYLSAFAARNSLPDFMMSLVHVDGDQNALTLSGSKPLVEKLRRDLEKLDQPIPQIEVETTAVEFGSTHDIEVLADLDGRLKASEVGMKTDTGDIKVVFAGALPDAFNAQVHALEAQSKATVRAHAKSVVSSGQTADLFAGQRQLVQIQYFDNFLGVYTARIITLDLGMSVKVQPWSGGGDTVMVNVQPSVTSVVDKEVGTGLPTLSTRTANATLRIQSGETVMIGGLRMNQDQHLDRGIAGLSSLGLLGLPFQAPKKTRSQTELVFFVTVRVVAGKPYVPPSLGAGAKAGPMESHL